jgi:hypothetical protein
MISRGRLPEVALPAFLADVPDVIIRDLPRIDVIDCALQLSGFPDALADFLTKPGVLHKLVTHEDGHIELYESIAEDADVLRAVLNASPPGAVDAFRVRGHLGELEPLIVYLTKIGRLSLLSVLFEFDVNPLPGHWVPSEIALRPDVRNFLRLAEEAYRRKFAPAVSMGGKRRR